MKPASINTAGIFVLFKTTKLGLSTTPLSSNPIFVRFALIFLVSCAFKPLSSYTKVCTPLYWFAVGAEFLWNDTNKSAPALFALVAFSNGVS